MNSIVTLCPCVYAYFCVVTETGDLFGSDASERRAKRIRRECTTAMKTDFKEKTGLVPWCRLEVPVKVMLTYTYTYCCSLCILIVTELILLHYPED